MNQYRLTGQMPINPQIYYGCKVQTFQNFPQEPTNDKTTFLIRQILLPKYRNIVMHTSQFAHSLKCISVISHMHSLTMICDPVTLNPLGNFKFSLLSNLFWHSKTAISAYNSPDRKLSYGNEKQDFVHWRDRIHRKIHCGS